MKNKLLSSLFIIFLSANAGFCEVSRRAAVSDITVKFGMAMVGVVLSSIILFIGLSIYNKFFVERNFNKNYEEEILKTPKTTEDAIKFFISKNRLD